MLAFLFGSNQSKKVPQPQCGGKNRTQNNRVCSNYMSSEPGIYQLENFHQRGINPANSCLPGFNPHDGFGIPQGATDVSSRLRHEQKLTQMREINQFGSLPLPTIPNVSKGCHFVDTETALLQGQITYKDNSCIPRDTNYHPNRSFQIFDGLCYNPNDHAVEPFLRTGIDTRHDRHRRQCGKRGSCRCPCSGTCYKCKQGMCGCGLTCKC